MSWESVSLYLMSALYLVAGIFHVVKPKPFLQIVPPRLPYPLFLVYVSGAAEIALGVLLHVPSTRSLAAWGIIALLIAVFPANIYMAQLGERKTGVPKWALLVRLPFQFVLMAWAYFHT